MTSPHLCVVHNNIDQRTSIGKLAVWAVQVGLDAGWEVSAVCHDLDPALAANVRHLPLHIPRPPHVRQYALAERTVRHALAGRRPGVMHVFQTQLAPMADTWHVSFLVRASLRRGAHAHPTGLGQRLDAVQLRAVNLIESVYVRRLDASTEVLFCSELMRDDFDRFYGLTPRYDVLYNPAFGIHSRRDEGARAQARGRLVGDWPGRVVAFLGGVDQRKGYHEVLDNLAGMPDTVLLFAGPESEGFRDSRLGPRLRALGMLSDVTDVLLAADALLVPSRFDPFALVVVEALAHGTPVIVAPGVGMAALVSEHGCGVIWDPEHQRLEPALVEVDHRRAHMIAAGDAVLERLSVKRQSSQLLAHFQQALSRGSTRQQ